MQKERRSLFEFFFGKKKDQTPQNAKTLQMLNTSGGIFSNSFSSSFYSDAYENDVFKSAVDAIARNGAKMSCHHIRKLNGKTQKIKNSQYERLLSERPNQYMSAYNFFYKVITQLYATNNAFVYLRWNSDGTLFGAYPINSGSVEFLEYEGNIYLKFIFLGSQVLTVPYEDVVHLRRFFYNGDLSGDVGHDAINPALKMLQATNDGLVNAIKSSANVRGILRYNTMTKMDDMKKQVDDFIANYLAVSNNGGVLAVDNRAEYTPLNIDPKIVDGEQMRIIEDKVFAYLGISRQIVQSTWNEDEWNAFYESTLEPLSIQMAQEFSYRLFTERERGFGNKIIFETSRLQSASPKTKKDYIEAMMPLGIMTINEAREIINLSPVDNGDKRLMSLNYVDADKANQYQIGKQDEKTNEIEESDDTEESDEDQEDV